MSVSIEAMLVTWLQIVPTLTALTTALVRKDTLGTDIHAKVWSSHKTSQIKKNSFLKSLEIWCLFLSSNVMAIHFCSQMSTSVAMATMFAMLIQTVTTQMVLIFVHARKDTLEMDSHVKVNKSSLHYLKQAALHISFRQRKLVHILKACFHTPLSYTLLHHLLCF